MKLFLCTAELQLCILWIFINFIENKINWHLECPYCFNNSKYSMNILYCSCLVLGFVSKRNCFFTARHQQWFHSSPSGKFSQKQIGSWAVQRNGKFLFGIQTVDLYAMHFRCISRIVLWPLILAKNSYCSIVRSAVWMV